MGNHVSWESVATIKRITGKSGHAARSHILFDARLTLHCHCPALSNRPRFIVCDDPTSALDVSLQTQVLKLVATLQTQIGDLSSDHKQPCRRSPDG